MNQASKISEPTTKKKDEPKLYVVCSLEQWMVIQGYARFAYENLGHSEIGGMGFAELVEKPTPHIRIHRFVLLRQDVDETNTDLDPDAINELSFEAIKQGIGSTLRVWWHSHGKMGCFWSPKDIETINEFRNEWFLSVVVNIAGEVRARVDFTTKAPKGIRSTLGSPHISTFIDNVPFRVEVNNEAMRQEVISKVARYPDPLPVQKYLYSGTKQVSRSEVMSLSEQPGDSYLLPLDLHEKASTIFSGDKGHIAGYTNFRRKALHKRNLSGCSRLSDDTERKILLEYIDGFAELVADSSWWESTETARKEMEEFFMEDTGDDT